MAKYVIHEHQRHHGLDDRRGADADAGIMASLRHDLNLLTVHVEPPARQPQAGGRLEGRADHDVLTARYSTKDTARVVAEKPSFRHLVPVLGAFLGNAVEPGPDFDALGRIDAHHGAGQICVELAVYRRSESRRHVAGDHVDAGADRIPGLSQRIHVVLEFGNLLRKSGVRVSMAESIDAFQALDELSLGERDVFRDALRATMVKIADGDDFKMPATIDDPAILDEIRTALQTLGYAG